MTYAHVFNPHHLNKCIFPETWGFLGNHIARATGAAKTSTFWQMHVDSVEMAPGWKELRQPPDWWYWPNQEYTVTLTVLKRMEEFRSAEVVDES